MNKKHKIWQSHVPGSALATAVVKDPNKPICHKNRCFGKPQNPPQNPPQKSQNKIQPPPPNIGSNKIAASFVLFSLINAIVDSTSLYIPLINE